MLAVEEVLSGKITLDIECVDRVYLNGYVKYLQMPGGVVNFIREQIGWPIPSPKVLYEMTKQFRAAVESFAVEQGLEIITFNVSVQGIDQKPGFFTPPERLPKGTPMLT